jgi:hypothetical protein
LKCGDIKNPKKLTVEMEMFNLFFVTIILLLFSGSAASQEIEKKQWIDSMSIVLPTKMCQSGQYFRECFSIPQTECEEVAHSATRICLKEKAEEMPSPLKQPEDGSHWGWIIGVCAGNGYEITLENSRIDSDRCNNPPNWMR